MAKNGSKIPGLDGELDAKIRDAQDKVRCAQEDVKTQAKHHEAMQRQVELFKAGLSKITGEPAPFIAEHFKTLERSAKAAAEDERRRVREGAAIDKELADLVLARQQLKEMRG
jgi:hypothetical protein